MTNWTHTLDISDLHSLFKEDKIGAVELGKEVATRLHALVDSNNPPLPEVLRLNARQIASRFKTEVGTIDEYDAILEELYDWADISLPHSERTPLSRIPKVCWVNT